MRWSRCVFRSFFSKLGRRTTTRTEILAWEKPRQWRRPPGGIQAVYSDGFTHNPARRSNDARVTLKERYQRSLSAFWGLAHKELKDQGNQSQGHGIRQLNLHCRSPLTRKLRGGVSVSTLFQSSGPVLLLIIQKIGNQTSDTMSNRVIRWVPVEGPNISRRRVREVRSPPCLTMWPAGSHPRATVGDQLARSQGNTGGILHTRQ